MTPPLFLVDPGVLDDAVAGGAVQLDGAEGRHAVAVKRLATGQTLTITDGTRHAVTGHVEQVIDRDRLLMRIDAVTDVAVGDPFVCVAQAIPKGERAERAVAQLTEVGVDSIVPFMASRCVVQWHGARGERAREKWVTTARESAKQARRLHVPAVGPASGISDIVGLISDADASLVLHEDADDAIGDWRPPAGGRIVLVVGPEGGLTPDEVAACVGAGARAVRLGPSVMRASTAGAVAAGVVLSRTRRWA